MAPDPRRVYARNAKPAADNSAFGPGIGVCDRGPVAASVWSLAVASPRLDTLGRQARISILAISQCRSQAGPGGHLGPGFPRGYVDLVLESANSALRRIHPSCSRVDGIR